MNAWGRFGRVFAGVMVFLTAVVLAVGVPSRCLAASAGENALDFELKDLSGETVKLSSYQGQKPVLIYFWATWCPYCLAVKPKVAELRQKVSPSALEILGVNVGGSDTLERLKRYQEAHPAAYPILFDGDQLAARAYHVQGIPTFILVDKQGKIVYKGNSPPEDEISKLVR